MAKSGALVGFPSSASSSSPSIYTLNSTEMGCCSPFSLLKRPSVIWIVENS